MKKKAFIPISALVGALLLAIIAAMTPFVAERNLAYAQTNSDIATLSSLRVSTELWHLPLILLNCLLKMMAHQETHTNTQSMCDIV